MKLHQAKPEDLELIRELLKETALWLKAIGSTQWSDILERRDNHDVSSAIKRGEVYYATIAQKPAGMFILWPNQSDWDVELWGEEKDPQWLYLHRLTIRRQYSGTALSQHLIGAAKEIAKNKQKKGIRLDCMAERKYLNRLYLQAGFTFFKKAVDWNTGDEKADFNLYQYSVKG